MTTKAAAATHYVIRCGKRGEFSYLLYLSVGFGWTGDRKKAARFIGKADARAACDSLEAQIRAYYTGRGDACPNLRLSINPATGGAAINRR